MIKIIIILTVILCMMGCSFLPTESDNNESLSNMASVSDIRAEVTDTTSAYYVESEDKSQNAQAPYIALIADFSDSVSSLALDKEYNFADEEAYKNVIPSKSLTIEIDGSTYSGRFNSSFYNLYSYSPLHIYFSDEATFYINSNGDLKMFTLNNASKADTSLKVLPEEECIEIAKQFMGKYISAAELSQYTVSIDKRTSSYYIEFCKYVSGLETNDRAMVEVTFSGQIISYFSFMLGEIPCDTTLSETDTEAIKVAVMNRIDEIYEHVKGDYDEIVHNEISKLFVIKLKSGSLGVTCTVTTDCLKYFDKETVIISEVVSFVIPINN